MYVSVRARTFHVCPYPIKVYIYYVYTYIYSERETHTQMHAYIQT